MLPFDPDDPDLLERFCAQPFGPYPPALEPFARWVWYQPGPGRWVLLTLERHRRWQLAWYRGERGEPLEPVEGAVFDSVAAGAAAIARHRWALEVEPRRGAAASPRP